MPSLIRVLLVARSAGRCQFDGCNEYLFEHHLTLREGNFAQVAHIVAFSKRGPRGATKGRPTDIHSIDNIMLLCPSCHKEIDDRPSDFSIEALRKQKADHEAAMRFLTDIRPGRKTAVIQFKALVRGQMVDIPNPDIATAVAPRYPSSKTGYPIDLTAIEGSGEDFYQTAKTCIDRKLALYYVPGSEVDQARHVSLFAIGPIPLLAYLGSGMSDKIHVDLFQRHRDTGDWTWKQDGPVVEFETRLIRRGTNAGHVALLISISGTIVPATIPPAIDSSFDVYEIAPAGVAPGTEIMRRRESLDGFRAVYRRFLARVVQEHRECRCIHVFPAVPVPVAVAIGLDRMRHVQPHLAIYSNDGPEKGFVQAVTIGEIDAN